MAKTYQVTCQYCGEEFTAHSSRALNCNECSEIFQVAYKKNGYRAATDAATEVHDEDLTPAERREVIRAAAESGGRAWNAKMTEIREAKKVRKQERIADRRAREAFYEEDRDQADWDRPAKDFTGAAPDDLEENTTV